jgi:hypothetical protein
VGPVHALVPAQHGTAWHGMVGHSMASQGMGTGGGRCLVATLRGGVGPVHALVPAQHGTAWHGRAQHGKSGYGHRWWPMPCCSPVERGGTSPNPGTCMAQHGTPRHGTAHSTASRDKNTHITTLHRALVATQILHAGHAEKALGGLCAETRMCCIPYCLSLLTHQRAAPYCQALGGMPCLAL